MKGKVLAVDPGDKRMGIAISDNSGTIANPLTVISHVQRRVDAAAIAQIAAENDICQIVVGEALGEDNEPTPSSRKAERLAEEIRNQTSIPVVLWDESGSTLAAKTARREMKVKRKKRTGHLDDIAATVILQNFLDTHTE